MEVIESISWSDCTKLFESTECNGAKVILIGLGGTTILCKKSIDETGLFEKKHHVIGDIEALMDQLDDKMIESCNGSMDMHITDTIFEMTLMNASFAVDSLKDLLYEKKISHHARFMQNQNVRYNKPMLRPAIVMRGCRESKLPDR